MRLEYAGARHALRFAPREGESFEVTLGDVTEASAAIWSGRDLDLTTRADPSRSTGPIRSPAMRARLLPVAGSWRRCRAR